jgi:hypothetical protein
MLTDNRTEIARQKVLEALAIADGEPVPTYTPTDPVELNEAHLELNFGQVMQGVLAMMLTLNIPGGNCYGMDLYAVNYLYLLNPEAAAEMNKVLCKFGRKPN